jgi:hypothetical protein
MLVEGSRPGEKGDMGGADGGVSIFIENLDAFPE